MGRKTGSTLPLLPGVRHDTDSDRAPCSRFGPDAQSASPDNAHIIRQLGQVAELQRRGTFPEALVFDRKNGEVALFSDGESNRLVLAIASTPPYLSTISRGSQSSRSESRMKMK